MASGAARQTDIGLCLAVHLLVFFAQTICLLQLETNVLQMASYVKDISNFPIF